MFENHRLSVNRNLMNHCRHAVIEVIDLFHSLIFVFNFIFRHKVIFRHPVHTLIALRNVVLLCVNTKKVGKLKNKRKRFMSYPVRPVLWYSKTVCHGPKLILTLYMGNFVSAQSTNNTDG